MTKDEALKLALEALQFALHIGFPESSESQIKKGEKAYQQHRAAITAIREALAQPVQEPVAHTVAGALFDFMGWLTSRKERIVLSSADEASPAVDAIRDFATKRGLSLDDAQVREWIDELAQPAPLPSPLSVQPEERNFCPRCGKRTADLAAIHTCTPPQEKNNG